MKNLAAVAAELRKNVANQKNINGSLSLRSTKTSEISNFVKNVNLAETHILKRELGIWHKDTNFELRKMNRKQEGMYKSLLRLSKAKKVIKTVRQELKKDKQEEKNWIRSKRRQPRRQFARGSEVNLKTREEDAIDEIAVVAEVNSMKIIHEEKINPAAFNPGLVPTKPDRPGFIEIKLHSREKSEGPLSLANLNVPGKAEEEECTEGISDAQTLFDYKDNSEKYSGIKDVHETAEKKILESSDNLRFLLKRTTNSLFEETKSNESSDNTHKLPPLKNGAIKEEQNYPPKTATPIPGLTLKQAYLSIKTDKEDFKQGLRLPANRNSIYADFFKDRDSDHVKISHQFQEGKRDDVDGKKCSEVINESELLTIEPPLGLDSSQNDNEFWSSNKETQDNLGYTDALPPIFIDSPTRCRKRKRRRVKMRKNKPDPSEELNNRSCIEVRPGKIYDVTVYKKDANGNFEEEDVIWDTTVDVAKYFNLAVHRERLQRKQMLDDAKEKEAQQRHRVNAFIDKLNREKELKSQAEIKRQKEAEKAKLAFQRRLDAIKRGPPKYGVPGLSEAPNYVRKYVKPSSMSLAQRRQSNTRKRSSWSVPSLFTLQIASASSRATSSLLNSSFNSGVVPAAIPGSSASHLVNINIDKYLLDAQEG